MGNLIPSSRILNFLKGRRSDLRRDCVDEGDILVEGFPGGRPLVACHHMESVQNRPLKMRQTGELCAENMSRANLGHVQGVSFQMLLGSFGHISALPITTGHFLIILSHLAANLNQFGERSGHFHPFLQIKDHK